MSQNVFICFHYNRQRILFLMCSPYWFWCRSKLPKWRIIPSKDSEKSIQVLNSVNSERLIIRYKLSKASICNNYIYIPQTFIMVKDLAKAVILANPFIYSLFPIKNRLELVCRNLEKPLLLGYKWTSYKI